MFVLDTLKKIFYFFWGESYALALRYRPANSIKNVLLRVSGIYDIRVVPPVTGGDPVWMINFDDFFYAVQPDLAIRQIKNAFRECFSDEDYGKIHTILPSKSNQQRAHFYENGGTNRSSFGLDQRSPGAVYYVYLRALNEGDHQFADADAKYMMNDKPPRGGTLMFLGDAQWNPVNID
jgi:hypothetical protein